MAVDAGSLKALIERELAQLSDARVTNHIRELLVEPRAFLCDWDYGEPGQQYVCWEVLKNWIVYCESGFGPKNPWGLIAIELKATMGMNSGWYPSFLDAYFESAAADLPIWRVFKTVSSGDRQPITPEDTWDATWKQVMEWREADTASRYDCDHSIACGRR